MPPPRRLGRAVEEIHDHRHGAVARVDDAESHQPTRDRRKNDDPPIDVEERDDDFDDGDEKTSHAWLPFARLEAPNLAMGRVARKPGGLLRYARAVYSGRCGLARG